MKYNMSYIKKDKKTKREYAIEALEILKKEGIDVSNIAPKRRFNGVKRYIFLREVRDDRINEIIKKYNLNPNLNLGSQIYIMRTKIEKFNFYDRDRVLALGIKKKDIYLSNSSGKDFQNQIKETLYLLEQLRNEGIDTAFIPRIVNGKIACLKDIDCPEINQIIKKLGLSEDLPIGKKIIVIIEEYSDGNKRHSYEKSEDDVEKIRRLGLQNSYEKNIRETMSVLGMLIERGIDITSIKKDIINPDGTKRKRYLFEINDERIEEVIRELDLPRYYLIGKRLIQVKSYMISEKYPKDEREAIKKQLIEWNLYRDREKRNSESELEKLEDEQKKLVEKVKEVKELKKQVLNEVMKRKVNKEKVPDED